MLTKQFIFVLFLGLCFKVRGSEISKEIAENKNYKHLCKNLGIDCLRNYLTEVGKCTPTSHNEGEPVYMEEQIAYIQTIGLVIICNRDNITYTGYEIIAFYKDKTTDQVVLVIRFKGIRIETPYAKFTWANQMGKAPYVVTDYVKITYAVVLVITFPSSKSVSMKDAIVTSYQTNDTPEFDIGKNITESSNEVVQAGFQGFLNDIPRATEQLFLTKGPYFAFNWLQTHVADCGYRYTGALPNAY